MNEVDEWDTININDVIVDNTNEVIEDSSESNIVSNGIEEKQQLQVQAQAPYYYDYYGEKTLENHQTIIQNQGTIIQNGYVISFLLAIILIVSVLRNMLIRR